MRNDRGVTDLVFGVAGCCRHCLPTGHWLTAACNTTRHDAEHPRLAHAANQYHNINAPRYYSTNILERTRCSLTKGHEHSRRLDNAAAVW